MKNIITEISNEIEQSIDKKKKDGVFIVAIDGMCGSGKSTLAEEIAHYFGCPLVHVDDFFLPEDLRTDERLNQTAGNFHYERFEDEIIGGIKRGYIKYKKFDCSIMDFSEETTMELNNLIIIEGSYSFSHNFIKSYDYTIFTKCSEETQLTRLKNRVGEQMLKQFKEKWIPMENKYFREECPEESADKIINT